MAFFEYTVHIEADNLGEADEIMLAAADATAPCYFSFAYEGQMPDP